MEQINPQKALEMLAQPTKAGGIYTEQKKQARTAAFQFQTFNDPQLKAMLAAAILFTLDMRRNINPRWLVLLGATGSGKTHIAKAINSIFQREMSGLPIPENEAYKMGGRLVSWRKAADSFRSGNYATNDMEENYFMAFDDIGAEYKAKTDFIISKLDGILDARLGKWTVITANLTMEQIADFMDVRIASRLKRGGSEVLELDTTDFTLR